MLRPTLVAPAPATTLVTLAEAKAHCRVDDTDSDTLITALLGAAESYLDGYSGRLGRALLTQTWEQKFWNFYEFCDLTISGSERSRFPYIYKIRLPVGIASSIESIKYYDTNNDEQTLDTAVYQLLTDDRGSYVSLKPNQSWPGIFYREDAITIQWKAGYGATAATVPLAIRLAVKMMVAHWYENRGVIIADKRMENLPLAVEALLAPFTRVSF